MSARRYIIDEEYEKAHEDVYKVMLTFIQNKTFAENSLELLPAYFILAEANIGMGGPKALKKAEEFLIAAKWNLLQKNDDEKNEDKGRVGEELLVDEKEKKRYNALLSICFGKLFMAQGRDEAINELTSGIYEDSCEHGPESIELCGSYYQMGLLFQQRDDIDAAKSFYLKICEIWKKYVLGEGEDYQGLFD